METIGKQAMALGEQLYQKVPQKETKPPGIGVSERVTGRLWVRMSETFGRQWEASYGAIGGPTFETWHKTLQDWAPERIAAGLQAVIDEGGDFPPNLIKFRRLMKQTIPNPIHQDALLLDPPKNNDPGARERHFAAARELGYL